MTRLRPTTKAALHSDLAAATLDWKPAIEPTSLDRYVVSHGVPHLFELGRVGEAEERMLDIAFMASLALGFESVEEPLFYWRAVGMQRADEGFSRTAREFPGPGPVRIGDLADTRTVGLFLIDAGLVDSGAALLEALGGALEEHLDGDDSDLMEVHSMLAFALEARGDLAGALQRCTRSVRGSACILGPGHALTLNRRNHQGRLLQGLGRLEEAVRLFRENHRATASLDGDDHPNTLVSMSNLGSALAEIGNNAEALPLLEEAHAGLVERLGPTHPTALESALPLAHSLLDGGDPQAALLLLEESADQQELVLGAGHPALASTLHAMACIFFEAEEFETARSLFERVLEVREAALGAGHHETESARYELGRVLGALGFMDEAREMLERRLRAPDCGTLGDRQEVASTHFMLAQILQSRGEGSGAADHLRIGSALEEQLGEE